MSRITQQYPERVYASSTQEKQSNLMEQIRSKGRSRAWVIGGAIAIGLGIWAAYKFGPDFARYIKMERM